MLEDVLELWHNKPASPYDLKKAGREIKSRILLDPGVPHQAVEDKRQHVLLMAEMAVRAVQRACEIKKAINKIQPFGFDTQAWKTAEDEV